MFNRLTNSIFRFLASLKLAVVTLTGLTLSLATATSLESYYDTPTAQFWVYRALWFHALLGLLGVNIFVVAVSRWPWKKRHTPFLLAHLGILMMLLGSWITEKYGLDGSVRLPEGQTSAVVEIDKPQVVVSDSSEVHVLPIQWLPPNVKFSPIDLRSAGASYDLRIDSFISHAEPVYYFVPARTKTPVVKPAIQLNISGGPMRISEDIWLWVGEPGWRSYSMGPAWFAFGAVEPKHGANAPGILFTPSADASELDYVIHTSDGKISKGKVLAGEASGKAIETGWKGGVKLTLKQLITDATPMANYKPSHTQFGANAPPPAIHVVSASGGDGREVWLGLGDRAVLRAGAQGTELEVGYLNERVMMPFAIRLDRFQIDKNPGTNDPAAYSSRVRVEDGTEQPQTLISMNEPLKYKGLTVYQASYENSEKEGERPNVSIFAVNRDPGRPWKYGGSMLIVGGAILLFAMRYYGKRLQAKKEAA